MSDDTSQTPIDPSKLFDASASAPVERAPQPSPQPSPQPNPQPALQSALQPNSGYGDPIVTLGMMKARTDAGRAQIQDAVERVDPFFDIYAERQPSVNKDVEKKVRNFYAVEREEILGGLMLSFARLSLVELPTTIYPWTLMRGLLGDLKPGAKPRGPSRGLLLEVKTEAGPQWEPFEAASLVVLAEVARTKTWPSAGACARMLESLRALMPVARGVGTQVRARLRVSPGKLKDPAERRALEWFKLMEWVLACLSQERNGPLFLFQDYMIGLVHYIDAKIAAAAVDRLNPAACDVAVLELFALLQSCADNPDLGASESPLTLGSRGQSLGRVRKRVQRARLNAHRIHEALRRGWQASRGEGGVRLDPLEWSQRLLPELEVLGREVQVAEASSSGSFAAPRLGGAQVC